MARGDEWVIYLDSYAYLYSVQFYNALDDYLIMVYQPFLNPTHLFCSF